MNDSHLLLHRSEDRYAYYGRNSGLTWSDPLKCWLAFDPALIQDIQKSQSFRVVDHSGEAERIKEKLGVDLGHIEAALNAMPLGVEGEEHALRRKRLAKMIAARTDASLGKFQAMAEQLCAAHLGREGRSELVQGLFEPLILELAHSISGIRLQHNADFLSPTQIFDKALGLNRRRLINAQIGSLRQQARDKCPVGEADSAVSLAVLGTDSILGSLALSFVERVDANPGRKMSEIDWGEKLTRTAVPFIERVAVEPASVGGRQIKQGEIVRLYLDRFSMEPLESRDAFFGSGRHACLGRSLAQQAWRALAGVLSKLEYRVNIDDLQYREADCMFLFPSLMEVSVNAR